LQRDSATDLRSERFIQESRGYEGLEKTHQKQGGENEVNAARNVSAITRFTNQGPTLRRKKKGRTKAFNGNGQRENSKAERTSGVNCLDDGKNLEKKNERRGLQDEGAESGP